MSTTWLEVGFANIGRGAGVTRTRANVRRFLGSIGRGGLGALAEIDEANPGVDEHKLLRKAAEGTRLALRSMTTREPVFYDRDIWHLHPATHTVGMTGVPNQSPSRVVTDVVADHLATAEGFALVTCHWPTHAYNGPANVAERPTLRAGWDHCSEVARERIDYHRAAGRDVLWIGDTNRHAMPPLHPDEIRLFDAGPDHGGLILANGHALVGNPHHRVIDLNVDDHNGHLVRLGIRA